MHEPEVEAAVAVALTEDQVLDGRYRVVRLIGAGGMGSVYEAIDQRLKRGVALKVLNPELLHHATARSRMVAEAVALAAIRHANVVEIHNIFDYGDSLVLELELVRGDTLARMMERSGKLSAAESVRLLSGVLRGLEAIHAANLVHRDLKPSNILLNEQGEPKIADLGVAHDLAGRGRTRTGVRLGTPEYMSPEQIRGQKVDARSDIYAAGVVLYELVVGEVPFSGPSEYDVQEKHVHAAVDHARLASNGPPHIVEAVVKAMAKNPDDRWATASEMVNALVVNRLTEPSVHPEPEVVTPAQPESPTEEPRSPSNARTTRTKTSAPSEPILPAPNPTPFETSFKAASRKPGGTRRWAMIGGLAILLFGGVGLVQWKAKRDEERQRQEEARQEEARQEEARKERERKEEEARKKAREAHVGTWVVRFSERYTSKYGNPTACSGSYTLRVSLNSAHVVYSERLQVENATFDCNNKDSYSIDFEADYSVIRSEGSPEVILNLIPTSVRRPEETTKCSGWVDDRTMKFELRNGNLVMIEANGETWYSACRTNRVPWSFERVPY